MLVLDDNVCVKCFLRNKDVIVFICVRYGMVLNKYFLKKLKFYCKIKRKFIEI